MQIVESHHVEQLQLADLLIGAISYLHNQPGSSEAKQTMIERIKQRSHYSLRQQTLIERRNSICSFGMVRVDGIEHASNRMAAGVNFIFGSVMMVTGIVI